MLERSHRLELFESQGDWKGCRAWKGAIGWKGTLRVGIVLISFILNNSIRRIHSSVKHSFPYEVSLPV
jgi:hypothetical protein